MNKSHRAIRCHLLALFSLLLSLLLVACATTKISYIGIRPEINAPFTLDFLGHTYSAGYSALNPRGAIVEYFLPAEGPGRWTRLLALRLNTSSQTSADFIHAFHHDLKKKAVPYAVSPDPGTGGHSINFMALIRGDDPGLEFNIFRVIDRTNHTGIISFQYAEILKEGDTRVETGAELRTLRTNRNNAFHSLPFPNIELKEF